MIYFVGYSLNNETYVKIGVTKGSGLKNLGKRVRGLQTGCPHKIHKYGYFSFEKVCEFEVEKSVHSLLSNFRSHGEWFLFKPYESAFVYVADALDSYSLGLVSGSDLLSAFRSETDCDSHPFLDTNFQKLKFWRDQRSFDLRRSYGQR